MRVVLAVVILLMSLVSNAQSTFAPKGAQWLYYLPANGGPFYPETEEITTVSGDTVIDGIHAKILVTERRTIDHFHGGNPTSTSSLKLIAVVNDSILFYENEQSNLVFQLGVTVDDTLSVFVGQWNSISCDSIGTMVITEVTDTSIHGSTLTKYSYKILEATPAFTGNSYFIERIGFLTDYPVVLPLICDFPGSYFQPHFFCYSDNQITVSPNDGCGQILSLESANTSLLHLIYSSSGLTITNAQNSTFRIFDVLGKELYQQQIYSDNESIDISHLPNGVLLVSVESEKGRLTKKVYHTH